jgi:hypothetical protein
MAQVLFRFSPPSLVSPTWKPQPFRQIGQERRFGVDGCGHRFGSCCQNDGAGGLLA